MIWIILFVVSLVLILMKTSLLESIIKVPAVVMIVKGVAVLVAIFAIISTSYVTVDSEHVGHLKRIYLGKSMEGGRYIALTGENGPQAKVLSPGFHFSPFINVLNKVEYSDVVHIPDGQYGRLIARDGASLRSNQFIADRWPVGSEKDMLSAEYFLTNGGQKGPQLNVLEPGAYRLNRYLFDVIIEPALDVPTGHVAVIKSNVQELAECPDPKESIREIAEKGGLAVPLVPKGCIGVWDEPLLPNRYYINRQAYNVNMVPTQVQTWTYKGGFTLRKIDLTVSQEGRIMQNENTPINVPVPENAADGAVVLTVEGWRVPQELRALVQVEPQNAPLVVASVGDLDAVENKIVTPGIRSVLRNETGRYNETTNGTGDLVKGNRDMDLISKRKSLESAVENELRPEALKAGVTIKEIRLGDPVLPPELLIARQRRQLAGQLKKTYQEEKNAQEERIKTEKSRATADQQTELVRSEIAVKVADQNKLKLQKEGEGEKLRLMEIAEGQKAQVNVLGEARVQELAMLKAILAAATENPDIVKVPMVHVQGDDASGLNGPAAVLGASNIMHWMNKEEKKLINGSKDIP